ncbi:MAG TPA: DUF559 domain-containing protein [Solirubrobacteraceae bacterium]|nr:DUF559 domain-containing protein [Solirubrobacteraceae bacterium]
MHIGVSDDVIAGWVRAGYLYRRLPGVYAVGHVAPSVPATLCAALLWAGPGAMLSHATGVWWRGLSDRAPRPVQLVTPRQMRSRPGIRVYGRSRVEREWHRGLPVAPTPDLLLQYATIVRPDDLRYVLSQAAYHGSLDPHDLRGRCGRGIRGSAKLRAALARHLPQLALTRSWLERRMLFLCERHGIPIPECNVHIEGFLVDAVWREQKVIVEVDGKDGHAGWERMKADHHRDLIHRAAGYTTLRYVSDQFAHEDELVATDILKALSRA